MLKERNMKLRKGNSRNITQDRPKILELHSARKIYYTLSPPNLVKDTLPHFKAKFPKFLEEKPLLPPYNSNPIYNQVR